MNTVGTIAAERGGWVPALRSRGRAITLAIACGILGPIVYIGADVAASISDPGYSCVDQAVSELFAIGAPTTAFVVRFFTLSSLLVAAFAWGVHAAATDVRSMRLLGWLIFLNAVDSLTLWNFFPMHMRGVAPTFTDTMHGALAINPFPLLTIVVAAVASRRWFRIYSIATIAFVGAMAMSAFVFVPAFLAGQPTPMMGLAERAGQYAHQGWQAVFACVVLRQLRPQRGRVRPSTR
jgi:hypothetical protein